MFQHGKAKEKKRELSETEKLAISKKLNTITTINQDILKKRNSENKEEKYDKKNLDYLFKASKLMTDSTTIWNYRKEIILYNRPNYSEEEFYALLKDEVKKITSLTMSSPKSYVLWNHREWAIVLATDYEIKNEIFAKSLIMQDILLCNLFLMKDNRNFHCWNYRLNLVILINKYFSKHFDKVLNDEIKFAIEKIKESCSNFSAWQYRAKLLAVYFNRNGIDWDSEKAIEHFNIDVSFLEKAIYTDPRDQSPWNYQAWLINSFSPITVNEWVFDKEKNILSLKFSDNVYLENVFNKELIINEDYDNNKETLSNSLKTSNYLSNKVKLDINKYISLQLSTVYVPYKTENDILSVFNGLSNKESRNNKISFTKHNQRMPEISIIVKENADITVEVINKLHSHQKTFLENQLKFVIRLIKDSEGFLEFALHRKVELNTLLLSIYKYNKDVEREELVRLRNDIISDYDQLISKSKRCSEMFRRFKSDCSLIN